VPDVEEALGCQGHPTGQTDGKLITDQMPGGVSREKHNCQGH
jgi:hypothetical protein